MLAAGEMSRWHPDPLAAFAEAPPDRHQKDCQRPRVRFPRPKAIPVTRKRYPCRKLRPTAQESPNFIGIERKKDTRSSVT